MGEKNETHEQMLQRKPTGWIQACMVRDNYRMKYSNQKYVYAFTDLGFIVCFCLSLSPVQSDFDFSAPGFQYFDINIIHELAIITKLITNSRSKN